MTETELLRETAFDLYERYVLLKHVAEFFRPVDSSCRVLDVGCGRRECLLRAMLPGAVVTLADVTPELPFADGSFDLVCALDALEHVPAAGRAAFIREILRVSSDGVYLATPFNSPGNRWARAMVNEYARAVSHEPGAWQSPDYGLPERADIAKALDGHACIEFAQGNADVWLLMMLTHLRLRTWGAEFTAELNGRFNQAYAAQDCGEPCYRAGYLVSKRRSRLELEQAQTAFPCRDTGADLQGVLALCNLMMSIAQTGRLTIDPDRQIRTIESKFADARAFWAQSDQTAAALRRLENQIRNSDRARSQAESEKAEFLAGQLDRLRQQVSALEEEWNARLDQRVQQLKGAAASDHARMESRIRDLELAIVTNRRAIQSLYDSRIWKILTAIGGTILRLTGAGRSAANGVPRPAAMENRGAQAPAEAGAFFNLVCDFPTENDVQPVRDVVEIRGWALAEAGVERVTVQIDDDPPAVATYGIARPDVARGHPQIAEAEHSGFRYFWDTHGLPEGERTVRVRALSRDGRSREVSRTVLIDWNTSPGYAQWIARNEPGPGDLSELRRESAHFVTQPKISIAVPVYKTPIPLLKACVDSVQAQTYGNWELCLADDGSQDPRLTQTLQEYARNDPRIRLITLEENRGISGATNRALQLCTGGYIGFLDHDDELAPFALTEVARAINDRPDTELFYSDEDKIDENGRRYDAFFKPEWSPELFLSYNYICHFVVVKRELLERAGGLDPDYSGAQDYEFLLRATEQTRKIHRIPKVLYHWRAIAGSAAKSPDEKPAASGDGERAIAGYLARNVPGAQVEQVGACRYRVRYPILGDPHVSILIPTGGNKSLYRAVDDVLAKTAYRNFEIVLIDNSRGEKIAEAAAKWKSRKAPVRYFDWRGQPFNFARMNNAAAETAGSPYILFLNDDTSIITREWLSAMLEHAQRPEIGAVGAQLWYPNGLIQHAGVVMGLYGNCSHAFKGLPAETPYYFDFPNLVRNCSAVTAACLLLAREKFIAAERFDEVNLAVAFQDVDLCLKLLELGYRNVYTPYARLYHYESATKSEEEKIPDSVEDAFMKNKWARYIQDDPYYNPNLARRKEDFSVSLD